MSNRDTLTNEFLELADRIERLREADPASPHLPDPAQLQRWQALYGNNADVVLQNRQKLRRQPAAVSTAELQEWVDYARKTLTPTPPDEP